MMRSSMRMLMLLASVTAFCPLPGKHRSTSLHVSWWDSDDESRHAAMRNNIMRTDLRNFLTQRSIQSFIHLCMECRDPHTVKWLEDFGGWRNLENFHGTGALNITVFPSWSTFFSEVMKQPEDVIIVSAKRRGRGHGGWSKNNPYLEDRYVEFSIDIDPPSLANRMLAVREQIGDEWVADLDTLKVVNDQILDNYNEKMRKAREEEKLAHEEEIKARAAAEAKDDDDDYVHIDRFSESKSQAKVAFDRNGMFFLRNSHAFCGDRAPSPLRQGNFDLLVLLATQESVHRVLRDYVDEGNEREMSFQWFRDFYVQRVAKYFDGNGEHGRADDFLEELMLTPPSVKSDEHGKVGLVDPLRIAENILSTRSKVCTEWKEIVTYTKEDHTIIRKQLLEKQMLKWGHKPKEADPVETTVLSDEPEKVTVEPVADLVNVTADSPPKLAKIEETTVLSANPEKAIIESDLEIVKITTDSPLTDSKIQPVRETTVLSAKLEKATIEPVLEIVNATEDSPPADSKIQPIEEMTVLSADREKSTIEPFVDPAKATTESIVEPLEATKSIAPKQVTSGKALEVEHEKEKLHLITDTGNDANHSAAANTVNTTRESTECASPSVKGKKEKDMLPVNITEVSAVNPEKEVVDPAKASTKLEVTNEHAKPLNATTESITKPLEAKEKSTPRPVKSAKEPADYIAKATKEQAFKSVTSSSHSERKPLPPPIEEEIEVYGEFQ